MLDEALRPVKDAVFIPLSRPIPRFISPTHITCLAFVSGVAACYFAAQLNPPYSLACWAANRYFDCLDGALARRRNRLSDLGAFLDALGDFIIFSAVPIAAAYGVVVQPGHSTLLGSSTSSSSSWLATKHFREEGPSWNFWMAIAVVEATFHVNSFILFFTAAMLEKRRASGTAEGVTALKNVAAKPVLVESFESGILLGLMLWYPEKLELLCWVTAVLVGVGIVQRTLWVTLALRRQDASHKRQ